MVSGWEESGIHGGSPRLGKCPAASAEDTAVPFHGLLSADGQEGVKPLNFLVSPPASRPLGFQRVCSEVAGPPRTAEGAFEGEAPCKCPENKRGMLGNQDADAVRVAGWKVPRQNPSESPQRNAREGCTSSG